MKPGIFLDIPGREPMRLSCLVLDYNGTLALDGELLPGVAPRLEALAAQLSVDVITADTYGTVRRTLAPLAKSGVCVHTLPAGRPEPEAKRDHLLAREAACCCAVGNGANDALMLAEAGLSIAVVGREGAAVQALLHAQLVVTHINDALDLLLHPQRCKADLRS